LRNELCSNNLNDFGLGHSMMFLSCSEPSLSTSSATGAKVGRSKRPSDAKYGDGEFANIGHL
jgi:hypothetical protein